MYFEKPDTTIFWVTFCLETGRKTIRVWKTLIFMLDICYQFMKWRENFFTEDCWLLLFFFIQFVFLFNLRKEI